MPETDLPPAAYHPTEEEFEEHENLVENGPATVSEIEQLIRVAFAIGGQTGGMDLAKKAIGFQKEHERENVIDKFEVIRDNLDESDDVWLKTQIHDVHDKIEQHIKEEKKIFERRMHWYNETVPDELMDKLSRSTSMHNKGVNIYAKEVVESESDRTDSNTVHIRELKNEIPLQEFGIELPETLLIFESPDSGKLYPFAPWFGTTTCTCGYKQDNPISTLCKHEVAALLEFANDDFDPDGIDIPERHKRLVSPQAYSRFTKNIDF